MTTRAYPHPLSGRLNAVSSKSYALRVILAAALSDSPTYIVINNISDDVAAVIRCVAASGGAVERCDDSILVKPGAFSAERPHVLNCGQSAAAARFLTSIAAALGRDCLICGDAALSSRPAAPLCKALRAGGSCIDTDFFPLHVNGALRAGQYTVSGDISSQFASGLLFGLALLDKDSELRLLPPVVSRPYIDMTVGILNLFGVKINCDENKIFIPGGQRFVSPGKVRIEGDWTQGAVWLCTGAAGGPVSVTGLSAASKQGDREICTILKRMGAQAVIDGDTVSVSAGGSLHGCEIDVRDIPDLVPPLAIAAAAAEGNTRIYGAAHLRGKESDRLESVAALVAALGGRVRILDDGLVITGATLTGGCVDAFSDHRIVMAAAAGSAFCSGPVTIYGTECISKSYPGFFDDFSKLGGVACAVG